MPYNVMILATPEDVAISIFFRFIHFVEKSSVKCVLRR
jgi:hypothetical protein